MPALFWGINMIKHVNPVTGEIVPGPFLRTAHNYDMNEASDESGLRCEDPSRTDQSFSEEVDINTIVRRFGLTGELPENLTVPQSGDFTGVSDYQSALNVVIAAQDAFMQMPAEVRAEFGNDPGRFVSFVENEKNRERAIELGIAVKKEEPKAPEPMLVRVVPEVSGGGTSST